RWPRDWSSDVCSSDLAMETWAGYAEEGRACLLGGKHDRLRELVDANFDLRAKIYQIDRGNLEMVHAARAAGATSNFAGSGGAIEIGRASCRERGCSAG